MRNALAALLMVVVACGSAGCGSSGEQKSAEAVWADGFCGSLTKWKTTVQSAKVQDTLTAVNVASAAQLEMSADISASLTTLESIGEAEAWQDAVASSKACQPLHRR